MQELAKLMEENRRMYIKLHSDINQLQAVATDEIKKLQDTFKTSRAESNDQSRKDGQSQDDDLLDDLSVQGLCDRLAELEIKGRKVAEDQGILRLLYFPRFTMRRDKIHEAHERTLNWIFKTKLPCSNRPIKFAEWLRTQIWNILDSGESRSWQVNFNEIPYWPSRDKSFPQSMGR
jgi:hypothetical protein